MADGPPSWQLARRARAAVEGTREFASARRAANVVVSACLFGLLVFAAIPKAKLPEHLHPRRDRLSEVMRALSLSQSWNMYAPDPSRGHHTMELVAVDRDGTERRLRSRGDANAWATAWAWQRTRRDIWQFVIMRRPTGTSRNRTWFLRGVCLREHRRGHDVARLEVWHASRSIQPPERVRAGQPTLGPVRRTRVAGTSCDVEIIRDMIAEDPRPDAVQP